jgi:predicted  nucleic acid-binding Zn-ribbon protein
LNEHIDQLITLQGIDLEIDQIENEIKAEQNSLDARIAALADRETLINELQEQIGTNEKERRSLEAEVADKMAYVKDRQSKMMQVQTGREQTALLKEIEEGKKSAKESEEKIVATMEEVEKLSARVTEERNLLKGEKELVTEETEKVRSTIETISKAKKEKDALRQQQALSIKESVLKKYSTLRERRNGLAVVNVLQGVCQGCYMNIPPQRYNQLLKGDQLFDCPTCQRIIYHRPEENS